MRQHSRSPASPLWISSKRSPRYVAIQNRSWSTTCPSFAGRRLDTWAYEKGASFDSSSPANRHRTRSSKASTVVSAKNASTSTGSSPWRTPSASSSNGVRTTTRFDLTAPSAILRQRSSLEVESSNRPDAQVPKTDSDLYQRVLPPLSVGEMTLRFYGALNYSQNRARDLRCTLNGA